MGLELNQAITLTLRGRTIICECVRDFLCADGRKGREDANAVMLGEGELSERDLRLTVALRAARIGVWDWDILTGRMSYSSRAREIYGFTPDQLVTIDDVRAATHADDLPRTSAIAERALDPAFRECPVFEFRLKSDEKKCCALGARIWRGGI
jgi:PAS domain-containing protein